MTSKCLACNEPFKGHRPTQMFCSRQCNNARYLKDITGLKNGRLTVIRFSRLINGKRYWECICECGYKLEVFAGDLKPKRTTSCGCYKIEMQKSNLRHGFRSKKPERFYSLWRGMKLRCLTPSSWSYGNYGAKGVTISESWLKFDNFLADMHYSYVAHVNKYGEYNTTIDRIDNNRGYCKENCRWATRAEQQSNRRSCHVIEYNGKKLNITQWAKELGIPVYSIKNRIHKTKRDPVGVIAELSKQKNFRD